MELAKYDLQPQEQLAVSLYLKSMNKTQAACDAGYGSTSVFNKPKVKEAIAEQLSIRAERLRLGGDWVLMELKRLYDRCMQIQEVKDVFGQSTGEFRFDSVNALRALNLIGKHVDIKAFDVKESAVATDDELIKRLQNARMRVIDQPVEERVIEPTVSREVVSVESIGEPIESSVESPAIEYEPEISFMRPPVYSADHVTDASEPDVMLSDEDKLAKLMEHWRR